MRPLEVNSTSFNETIGSERYILPFMRPLEVNATSFHETIGSKRYFLP